MKHEDLIIALASSASPVTPLPSPGVRTIRWMLATLVVVSAGVLWRGLRADWPAAVDDPAFVSTTIVILAAVVLSAGATFALAIPGVLCSSIARVAPLAAVAAWGGVLVGGLIVEGAPLGNLLGEPMVWGCFGKTVGLALVPGVVLSIMIARAAPLDARWTAGLATLAALSFGVLGTELICPIARTAHLFEWHFLPVVVIVAGAFVIPRKSFQREELK